LLFDVGLSRSSNVGATVDGNGELVASGMVGKIVGFGVIEIVGEGVFFPPLLAPFDFESRFESPPPFAPFAVDGNGEIDASGMVGKIVGFGVIGVGVGFFVLIMPPPFPLPGLLFDFGAFELFLLVFFGGAVVGSRVIVPNVVGIFVPGKVGNGVGKSVVSLALLFPFCFPLPFA
jgi:hypothetical protein